MNSTNKTTKVTGFLYLLMVPFAIFSMMYVPSILIAPGDATITANNIMNSGGLFLGGIASWLICQTIFVFLVLNLYRLLVPVNKNQAVVMAVLALLAVPVAFLNEINHLAALVLLSGVDYLTVFELTQLQAQVMFFLDLHTHGIYIAQIFWGLWLFPFGYLVFASGFLPKFLGFLLIVGGVGYLIDVVVFFLLPDFDIAFSPVTGIGEFVFPLWLLIRGVRSPS